MNEETCNTYGKSMGLLLGPPLAIFYVSHIKQEYIYFNSNAAFDFYTRYVGDVLCVFINFDNSDSSLDHLNQVTVPLKLTMRKLVKINKIILV